MKKNVRIYETLNSAQGLQKEHTDKGLRLTGVFGVCGKRNNNNRVYEKKNYGKMVRLLQEEIAANHGVMGELEHPNSMNINLNNVSHKIESINMNEDGTVTGTILLLNTTQGKQAQAIIEGGLDLYISSRASGNIDAQGNVVLESLKTYDLVGTPGFSEARLSLCESASERVEMLTESLCYVYEAEDDDEEDLDDDDEEDLDDDDEDLDEEDDENNKTNDTKIMKQILDRLNAIERKLAGCCSKKEVKESVSAIRDWVSGEYSDGIQRWIAEEYTPEVNSKIADGVQNWISEEFAPQVEKWVVEQYTPEVENWITEEYANITEKWIVEQFAPEVQNWITEEFSPKIEGWIVEQFAPQVQNWITEEYGQDTTRNLADGVQGWIQEELMPHMDKWISEELCPEIYNNVNSYIMESKKTSIDTIDAMLDMVENSGSAKEAVENVVKEADEEFKGSYVLESMPEAYRPLWTMCTEEKKADILNRSKLYDLMREGAVEKFWASVDFSTPVAKARPINENLSGYQKNVLAGIRRLRKY